MLKLDLQFFGGRGASGGGGGGGGATGELVLPNGSKIEFEGTLHYDGNDKALTGTARTVITGWEAKRVKNKVEYAYAVDADGNPIGPEVRGSKGSVRTPFAYHDSPDGTFTHIHPRGDGMLGGTFSKADLFNFANHRQKTERAAAKEGTYSISKNKNFDAAGFKSFASKANADFRANYNKRCSAAGKAYREGKISYEDYAKANAKAFNTSLVEMHNTLRSGQKQYGYIYTLEKTS